MGDSWALCAGFSVFAVVALSTLGSALKYEYEYIPVSGVSRKDAGDTCYYAAVVYVAFALFALCKVATRPKAPDVPDVVLPGEVKS